MNSLRAEQAVLIYLVPEQNEGKQMIFHSSSEARIAKYVIKSAVFANWAKKNWWKYSLNLSRVKVANHSTVEHSDTCRISTLTRFNFSGHWRTCLHLAFFCQMFNEIIFTLKFKAISCFLKKLYCLSFSSLGRPFLILIQ